MLSRSCARLATLQRHLTSAAPLDVSSYYGAGSNPDSKHKDYIMQQTMYRIADPKRSLEFYTKVLGMNLIWHDDFPQWEFSLYFVGYVDDADVPTDPEERRKFCMRSPACVELTYNYNDGGYHTGNTSDGVKGGFGHIGITVPDVYAACERFKELGVEFKKSPNSGGMKGLAFIKDPDGYWIEVLAHSPQAERPVDCCGVHIDGGDGYSGGGSGGSGKKE
eukprot:g3424.t1